MRGLIEQLLADAAHDLGGKREYPDAKPGSRPTAPRTWFVNAHGTVEHMPEPRSGVVRRWRSREGTLHRRRREAGEGACLVRLETTRVA